MTFVPSSSGWENEDMNKGQNAEGKPFKFYRVALLFHQGYYRVFFFISSKVAGGLTLTNKLSSKSNISHFRTSHHFK